MKQTRKPLQRNCYYCGKQMFSQRRTKKYCSDNCKQAAFYERNTEPPKETAGQAGRTTINGNNDEHNYTNQPASRHEGSYFSQAKSYYEEPLPTHEQEARPTQRHHTDINNEEDHFPSYDEDREPIPQTKALILSSANEEPYVWVYSKVITDITEYLQDNYTATEMLQFPRRHWYGTDLERVLWVSLRLHSLIEELLQAGQKKRVAYQYLVTIKSSFKAMTNDMNFRFLPRSYPLSGFIKNLYERILSNSFKDSPEIEFRIGHKMKVQLMAIRYQLADLSPYVPMKELDFAK